MKDVGLLIEQLCVKKTKDGCEAMNELLLISEKSDAVYMYMNNFLKLCESENSFVRTRGLLLICSNARWDNDLLIDNNIDTILNHITDEKPITARQFIQHLPQLVFNKSHLSEKIVNSLKSADTSVYTSSMKPLVDKDIQKTILIISDVK